MSTLNNASAIKKQPPTLPPLYAKHGPKGSRRHPEPRQARREVNNLVFGKHLGELDRGQVPLESHESALRVELCRIESSNDVKTKSSTCFEAGRRGPLPFSHFAFHAAVGTQKRMNREDVRLWAENNPQVLV